MPLRALINHSSRRRRHSICLHGAIAVLYPTIRYNRQSRRRGYHPVQPHTLLNIITSDLDGSSSTPVHTDGTPRGTSPRRIFIRPSMYVRSVSPIMETEIDAGGGARSKKHVGVLHRSGSRRVLGVVQPDWCVKSHARSSVGLEGVSKSVIATHVHWAGDPRVTDTCNL
jgi:hypothetical protein